MEAEQNAWQRGREKDIDWDRLWQWIARGDLKTCFEALMRIFHEQALRANCESVDVHHVEKDNTIKENTIIYCGIFTGNPVANVELTEL